MNSRLYCSVMRIKGEQLYLFSGEMGQDLKPLALSTDCALQLNADSVEVCRIIGAGRRYRKGLRRWSVDCERLLSISTLGAFIPVIGQPITIAITLLQRDIVEAGINLSKISPDKAVTLVGQSIIASISAQGSKSRISSYRISFQGNGQIGALLERNGFPYVLPIEF